MMAKKSKWLVLSLQVLLYFLFFAVVVIPFRYISLSNSSAVIFLCFRYFPTFICLLIIVLWMALRAEDGWSHLKPCLLYRTVILFFIVGLLSSLGSENPMLSLSKGFYYFITGGCLFVVCMDVFSRELDPRFPILFLLYTGYVVALYGIGEFAWGNPIYGTIFSVENASYLQLSPDPWFGRRIMSSIGHPVFLGAYLVVLIPLSLSFIFRENRLYKRLLFGIGTLCLFCALILTFSRGAWVAVSIAICFYFQLRGVQFLRHTLYLGGALVVAIIFVFSFPDVAEIFGERMDDAYENYVLNFASTSRGKALGHVVQMVSQAPLLGMGMGMYRFEAYVLGRDMPWPPNLDTPDNMYLLWLAEQGVLGLAIGLFFGVSLFQYLYRALVLKISVQDRELLIGLSAGLLGVAISMLTCSALNFPSLRMMFWMMFGMATAYATRLYVR